MRAGLFTGVGMLCHIVFWLLVVYNVRVSSAGSAVTRTTPFMNRRNRFIDSQRRFPETLLLGTLPWRSRFGLPLLTSASTRRHCHLAHDEAASFLPPVPLGAGFLWSLFVLKSKKNCKVMKLTTLRHNIVQS
jgi:hypothetical protein